jgi:TfoX/Sxy family transcriptional regulator of competence genes
MIMPLGDRDAGTLLMHEAAAVFPAEAGVTSGRMFNGTGLRTSDGFFAFVSSVGRLVVKLPEHEAHAMIDSGRAEPVVMGKRTMREWVSLAQPNDGDLSGWRSALRAAHAFATTGD